MRNIGKAKKEDVESILKLYKSQLGEPFCAWDDGYPCEENIADDLSRESLIYYERWKRRYFGSDFSGSGRKCRKSHLLDPGITAGS